MSNSKSYGGRQLKKYPFRQIITNHMQAMLFSLGNICRMPLASIMTIGVIAIALSLPSSLYAFLRNVEDVSNQWQMGTQISLFLQLDLSQGQIDSLLQRIDARPDVVQVNYISPDTGLEELQQQTGFSDVISQLANNPLPGVIEAFPEPSLSDPQHMARLLSQLSQFPEVESGQLDLQWLERLQSIIALGSRIVEVLMILFSGTVLLVIANALSFAINSRREEIEVFKLLGATNRFIHRPFLYCGLFYGFFGGISAWLLVALLLIGLSNPVANLAHLYNSSFSLMGLDLHQGVTLVCLSALLGLVAAYIVVNRVIAQMELH